MSPLMQLVLEGLVILVVAGGVVVLLRDTRRWLEELGPDRCPVESTCYGVGRDTRPDGLRCRHRPGHHGRHAGVNPTDGRPWYW